MLKNSEYIYLYINYFKACFKTPRIILFDNFLALFITVAIFPLFI